MFITIGAFYLLRFHVSLWLNLIYRSLAVTGSVTNWDQVMIDFNFECNITLEGVTIIFSQQETFIFPCDNFVAFPIRPSDKGWVTGVHTGRDHANVNRDASEKIQSKMGAGAGRYPPREGVPQGSHPAPSIIDPGLGCLCAPYMHGLRLGAARGAWVSCSWAKGGARLGDRGSKCECLRVSHSNLII